MIRGWRRLPNVLCAANAAVKAFRPSDMWAMRRWYGF